VSSPSNSKLPNLTGSGKPMNENLKAYFEPRFGVDLGNVRLHTDERANRLSEYVCARAFALGNDIAFAQGEYKPETEEGKKLIAHEIAHTMQGDDGTVRRQVEEGWLLRENGTIRFNDKKGLTVEYKDAEGKLKTETKKLADTRSLSRSLMMYIGGRKEAEKLLTVKYNYKQKDLEVKSDDDIAYLLMTTHGAGWNGTQYTQLENTVKKMWDKIVVLSNMKDMSLAERLVFTASPATRKLVEDLEKKSKQKYEEQKLKEQKERESYKPENFFKQYPSAKGIYEEHKLGSKEISEEARLNFMRLYKTLYDNLDKFKPLEWTETVKQDDGTTKSELHYVTKCNVYYDYYLRGKGYGRVLNAIDRQVFSPELNKQGSAEYNPELFKRRNNPVNHLVEYEKQHGDDIEIFTDPKKALDLTNQGHDVGVVGWYFDDDDIDKTKS
jgi:hypothetical protein